MKKQTKSPTKKVSNINAHIVAATLRKEAAPIIKKVALIEVSTIEQFNQAAELVKALKVMVAAARTEEDKFLVPLKNLMAITKEHFRPFFVEVDTIETTTKLKMSQFVESQNRAKLQLTEDLSSGKIKKLSTYVNKTAELEVRPTTGSVRSIKTLKIVDGSKIPREYLVPDEQKIKAALLAGNKVAGCELENKTSIAI